VRDRERNLSTQFAQMAQQSQQQAARLTGDAKDRAAAEANKYTHIARALDTSTDVVAVGETHRVYQIITPISDTQTVKMKDSLVEGIKREFSDVLDIRPALSFKDDDVPATELETVLQDQTVRPITKRFVTDLLPGQTPTNLDQNDLTDYFGGAAVLVENINPPATQQDLQERINRIDLTSGKTLRPEVIPLAYADASSAASEPASQPAAGAGTQPAARKVTRALVVATDANALYSDQNSEQWRSNLAMKVWDTTRTALTTSSSLAGVTSFDPVVAGQAKTQAILAIVISLILIVIYVWIRFGGLLYGLGAILSLLHDAIMALAATVLSGWIYQYFFGGHANWLLISDFKINLTAIAAYLTIIGYSVNDTIVVFDRIRENRGHSRAPLTAQLVNDSINQCLGRTIWTTFTVFIVVLILYIWGGEGIRGFAWAMLFGVFTGAYSTLAIASPSLLSVQPKVKDTAFPVKFGAPDEQTTPQ
jgi:SecD/SecF fusion protein